MSYYNHNGQDRGMEKKNKKETPGRKLIEREGEKNRGEKDG